MQLLVAGACFVGCIFLRCLVYQWWSVLDWYYIGPMPVPWWPIMVALALAMALSGLFFLSLILFLVQAHWMLAMALSGLFSWA